MIAIEHYQYAEQMYTTIAILCCYMLSISLIEGCY
jgi:hypothetical protein